MTVGVTDTDPAPARVAVGVERARALIRDVLGAIGADAAIATTQADALVEADLRGHASHGLQRLPMLVSRIRRGLADPTTTGEHHWRSEVALDVDGRRGLGPPVATRALDELVVRARETGVALAAIHDTNHLGMLAPYVERAAAAGVVTVVTTTSEPLVHAWGGRDAVVGTNPIAIGVPTAADPVVVDMATGAISRGKVIDHANRGEPLPPDVVVDADGIPTTDPQAALDGAISPFGGAKGYALAAGLEFFVGALTGCGLGAQVTGTLDADTICNKGDVLLCLAPELVAGRDRTGALAARADELRAARPRDPDQPVVVPGDRARAARSARLHAGHVHVSRHVWDEVATIAAELDLDVHLADDPASVPAPDPEEPA